MKMDWLMLSIMSAMIWGVAMVVNKHVVANYLQPLSFSFVAVLFDTAYVVLLAILTGVRPGPLSVHALAAAIAGFLGVTGGLLSYFSLKNENASIVSAIIASAPLYTLLLAILFLGENPTIVQVSGIILIVVGTIAVSLKPEAARKMTISEMLFPAVLSAVLFGSVAVFTKYSLAGMTFMESFVTRQIGASAALFPIGFLLLLNKDTPTFRKKSIPLVGLAEIGTMGSVLLFTLAASLGPVSSVYAVVATMPLFVFFWMFLLRKRLHFVDIQQNNKPFLLGTVLIIVGIYLIGRS